jgi:hypothetical protein
MYRRILFSTLLALSSLVTSNSIASAQIKERSIILNSNGNQSFDVLIQQAQNLAKNSIEQEFAENPEIMEISIIILGENKGQIAPLIRSKISRSQWENDSRIERWTRYFSNSRALLGFYNSAASSKPQGDALQVNRPARFNREDDPGFRDD